MPQIVPVQPNGNQSLTTTLNNQSVQLSIYQKLSGLYMDVFVNNEAIIVGVLCQNLNRIVRDLYLGFSGDFVWNDTQGTDDPFFSGLGTRFHLIYLFPSDLPPNVG